MTTTLSRSEVEPSDGETGAGRSRTRSLQTIERLAHLLDDRFRVPGTSLRFGVDGLLGLIPGVGDLSTAIISTYLIARARHAGARRRTLVRMSVNVLIDAVLGSIPLVGDLFDFGWKANRKNVRLVLDELRRLPASAGEPKRSAT